MIKEEWLEKDFYGLLSDVKKEVSKIDCSINHKQKYQYLLNLVFEAQKKFIEFNIELNYHPIHNPIETPYERLRYRLWGILTFFLFDKFEENKENEQAEEYLEELCDFLETNIPAFRCGYVQRDVLKLLKNTKLPANIQTRLKQDALEYSEGIMLKSQKDGVFRLMIKLADKEFLRELNCLIELLLEEINTKLSDGKLRSLKRSCSLYSFIQRHRQDLR
jgi:hypothetical protein